MKKIFVIILCLPVFVFAQKLTIPSVQSNVSVQDIFNINGIETVLGPRGFMWDLSDALYEVPKGTYYFHIKTNECVINKKVIYQ